MMILRVNECLLLASLTAARFNITMVSAFSCGVTTDANLAPQMLNLIQIYHIWSRFWPELFKKSIITSPRSVWSPGSEAVLVIMGCFGINVVYRKSLWSLTLHREQHAEHVPLLLAEFTVLMSNDFHRVPPCTAVSFSLTETLLILKWIKLCPIASNGEGKRLLACKALPGESDHSSGRHTLLRRQDPSFYGISHSPWILHNY